MQINVYMKNGLKFELEYPEFKNVGTLNKVDLQYDEDMLEAFDSDVHDLERLEQSLNQMHFITLDNHKKELTIQVDEIAAYEVIR